MGLNNRVTVQQRGGGEDALGQPVPGDWADVAVLWADVRNVTGTQAIQAGAQLSTVRASIRVRTRTDIAAGMRAMHGSTVYAIHAVLPDQRDRRFMDLICEVAT